MTHKRPRSSKRHGHRLADGRFAGDEFDLEAVGDFHAFDGFFGVKP